MLCMTLCEFPWDSVYSSKLSTLWSDAVLIVDVVYHIQWNTLTGLQQLSIGLFVLQRVLIFPHTNQSPSLESCNRILRNYLSVYFLLGQPGISPEEVIVQYGPQMWENIPGCFTSLLMNISATQQLTLFDLFFFLLQQQ